MEENGGWIKFFDQICGKGGKTGTPSSSYTILIRTHAENHYKFVVNSFITNNQPKVQIERIYHQEVTKKKSYMNC